ncbi:TPA: Type 1 glutamine amidotransferase-like domain-containing protein [Streptococcus agalactiae]|nr:Type 1 glutamine amidotransferase-like domain-containing protein [Streptococcus agalactiae]
MTIMKKLFLCSYLKGVESKFLNFVNTNHLDREVTFVNTASEVENYTKYVDEAIEVFTNLNFKIKKLDLTNESPEQIKKVLKESKNLYISGGNTFYLLEQFQKKKINQFINERVRNGMVYIGESAGSIVTSPNIEYNQIMDEKIKAPNLQNSYGLNLISFFPLVHYNEIPFQESSQRTFEIYNNFIDLVKINNNQAIIVTNELYSII